MNFIPEENTGVFSGRPWSVHSEVDTDLLDCMRREMPLDFQVSEHLLKVLASRGIIEGCDLDSFFYPSLDQLYDPFLLKEMDAAIDRFVKAINAREKVAVHGDFDVDGVTGSALLFEVLTAARIDGKGVDPVSAFIPDRATDGYGVAARKIREWASEGVTLLITVVTGAAAAVEIELSASLGMDVIVLDHHIFDERPPAVALVNPRRPGPTYPNGELCGVAVAFKFAQALDIHLPGCLPENFLHTILDLVALGLIADQMAIVGENRILVKKGLEQLNDRTKIRPGLAALLSVAGLDRGFPVTTGDFAYQLAPRINACGRIGRVMSALELMLTRDPVTARKLAEEADRTNSRRKEQDLLLKEEALSAAVPYIERGDQGLVLHSTGWHKGIIGIGAARLVEQYQVPVILMSVEGEEARGSARSIPNIDVKNILDKCSHLLLRYGGHAQAAGMTLRAKDIDAFRACFLEALASEPQTGPVPEGYDLELFLADMCTGDMEKLVREFDHLEPFGSGNRKPVFLCRGLQLQRPPTPLSGGAHLRFGFRGPANPTSSTPALSREFVSFGCGDAWRRMLKAENRDTGKLLEMRWDILFQVGRSTFRPRNGNYDPVQQLMVDIRPSLMP